MTTPIDNPSPVEKSSTDRHTVTHIDDILSLDMVSAYAGDRALTVTERNILTELKHKHGQLFFSDLLYAISHQYFAPEIAEDLWTEIVRHKDMLSTLLGRDIKIVVAMVDYLTNITGNMDAVTLVSEAHFEEIISLSLHDGLTGLFNHTYFYQQIDLEVKRYARYGTPVSLVLIDIDDFKQVNDSFGHREGDRVLAKMAEDLIILARDSDICCRYGGEEFAVILPLTGIHEAERIAERMRMELVQTLPNGKEVTVSMGVADCVEYASNLQNLVERADAALYHAKRSGKNRVMADRGGI